MGEVYKPNYFLLDGPTTVSQILARAGGFQDTAKLNNILIISRDQERKAVGKTVNIESVLGEANIGHDVMLKQYDVVYVPKTEIAKAGVFVDQYINAIIPNVIRVNFGYVSRWDD